MMCDILFVFRPVPRNLLFQNGGRAWPDRRPVLGSGRGPGAAARPDSGRAAAGLSLTLASADVSPWHGKWTLIVDGFARVVRCASHSLEPNLSIRAFIW